MRRVILLVPAVFAASCFHDAADPYSLTPLTPYSSWQPLKGNTMISAKFCQTLLPSNFESGEMNLAELIDIALQNNPTTKQTWGQARVAAAQYGESLSSFYPDIQFTSQYTRTAGAFVTVPPTTPFLTTQAGPDVQLSYTLFDFGQRSSASLAAREALYYADMTHNQQIQTVIQSVMDSYYMYLYQLKVLRADEANLANAQASLDAANQKFALGLVALGDVAQARTQFLQSRINLTTQKQSVEDAFAQLAVDLGLPANVHFKVVPMPEEVAADPMLDSIEQLVALAQTQRQDLLAAEANMRSKEASVLNARRAVYPVLATNLDVGQYWFQQWQTDNGHWTAELTLSFPLFQGFYYKNQVKTAESNLEVSKAQFLQTELAVIQSITTSHMNIKTSAQNLKDTEEYLKAAELEFDIALSSYKVGTATILDVLSAQSSLADARSKKANAQRSWFTALAAIAYATGSLCLPAGDIHGEIEKSGNGQGGCSGFSAETRHSVHEHGPKWGRKI